MATAHVSHRNGRRWRYEFPTPERAAQQLVILLRRDGYSNDPTGALLSGEHIQHKRFTYWVE